MTESSPIKLLAVDDIDDNLLALEALVAEPGIELIKARSGTEALEVLLLQEVAVALVDVQMPDMDGFELAEIMRSAPRTRSVPIIFVTAGQHDAGRVFRGYEAGAVDFLYKPIDPHILRSKVGVFVALQRQKLQLAQKVEALEEALRVNETLAAVVGHDLRSPLTSILTGAEHILRRSPEDDVVVRSAGRIRETCGRMVRMITELLDFVRVRQGEKVPVTPASANLGALCRRVLQELEPVLRDRAVELRIQGEPAGEWDEDRLFQVIANLLGNAVRHGDPANPIVVDVDGIDPERVRVSVTNGGAIPPDELPGVFEPFRKGARRDRSKAEGLGLGLYIVRGIVEAHGGRVDVRSTIEEGTTFSLDLPRRPGYTCGPGVAAFEV